MVRGYGLYQHMRMRKALRTAAKAGKRAAAAEERAATVETEAAKTRGEIGAIREAVEKMQAQQKREATVPEIAVPKVTMGEMKRPELTLPRIARARQVDVAYWNQRARYLGWKVGRGGPGSLTAQEYRDYSNLKRRGWPLP